MAVPGNVSFSSSWFNRFPLNAKKWRLRAPLCVGTCYECLTDLGYVIDCGFLGLFAFTDGDV